MLVVMMSGCDSNVQRDTTGPDPEVFPTDRTPAWSPGGDRIAYFHDAGETDDTTDVSGLYVLDLRADSTWLMAEGSARHPDWRPDGERIAFSAGNIYTVRPDGSNLQRLTDFGDSFHPDWSPDGKRLAFDTSYRDENGAHVIWLMDPDGNRLTDISEHGVGEWRDPDWSVEGRKLVHLRFLDNTFGEEIFVMDSTGANPVRLTNNERNDRSPAWSPDGEWIAWAPGTDDGLAVSVMRADGSDQKRLVEAPAAEPSWAPDSERLVFIKPDPETGRTALWTIRRDGSDLRQITDPSHNPLN